MTRTGLNSTNFALIDHPMQALSKVKKGETVTVHSVTEHDLKPRLLEMGLYPGKKVTVLFHAPFGDPIAVDVDGYVLSMRLNEAELINTETVDPT